MPIVIIMIMRKDIPAENMDAADTGKDIPVADADIMKCRKEKMWGKTAECITEGPLMTALSLILLMIGENRWNLYVVPV